MSELAFLEIDKDCQPFDLFNAWVEEYKKLGSAGVIPFALATASKDGKVSNRFITLRLVLEDSIVFVTFDDTKKVCQINENPKASVVFLFTYHKDGKSLTRQNENPKASVVFLFTYHKDGKSLTRQVAMEGVIMQLDRSAFEKNYDNDPLFFQIRAHICESGKVVDWCKLKQKHDALYHEVKTTGKKLHMPDCVVGYKLVPENFDFYQAYAGQIPDRIFFTKTDNKWTFCRISA